MRDKTEITRILKIIALMAVVLLLLGAVFLVFGINTSSKQSLRDAKNVYLALNTAQIEYYARGESIFDPSNYNGISDGVEQRVKELVDNEGFYRIVSFDSKNKKITELQYINNNFFINFTEKDGITKWEVKYLIPLFSYSD